MEHMEQSAEQQREQFRKKCLTEAGLTYSVAAVLPVLLSLLVIGVVSAFAGEAFQSTQAYLYLCYILPQLCFAAAAGVYFYRTKEPLKRTYCGCKWQYFVLAVLLQFGLLSLTELNSLFLSFLGLFGYRPSPVPVPDLSGWKLLPAMIVIAVLPAIFEETVFRGILVRNVKNGGWGTAAAVLVTGAMFALFHGKPEQTVYQFVCGACFALVALRSRSVFPTMAAHFLNNAVILVLEAAGAGEFSIGVKIPLFSVAGVVLAGVLVFLVFFDKNNGAKGGVKNGKFFFLAAAVGLAVCAAQWVEILVAGFLGG